jgi:hypothetical protein
VIAVSGWGRAAPWILLVATLAVLVGLSISIERGFRQKSWWPVSALAAVVVVGVLMVLPT